MNFQYYENLWDKSERNLFTLIDKIVPKPISDELIIFLDDFQDTKLLKKKKSSLHPDFIELTAEDGKDADLSQLTAQSLEEMYKTFISREMNNKKAIKWRFFQFLRYQKSFPISSLHIKATTEDENPIDIIIETYNDELVFINCSYILEKEYYSNLLENIKEFTRKASLIPDKIIFAAYKTYRDIPITQDVPEQGILSESQKELWVEWIELGKHFNGEDLLIVLSNRKKDLEIAGFNFSSTDNLLDYVYNYSRGGQVAIYKQAGFFSRKNKGTTKIEPVWRGIMLKNKI
ncbi:MAG: hypothetical protein BAJALOKI1v1_50017 [Promethearchaeota archaeon]|nr:MAG: hypothetical protein BAJALOKI1v1_50017 [Candidatus Lokiarchaeota archaeon]